MADTMTPGAGEPIDPAVRERVLASFARQGLMRHLGASVVAVAPGMVTIRMPFREELTQQHGYFHAGGTSAIADSAGGYAGLTMFPADSSVLTVEFKINLIAPAEGDHLEAVGRVVKAGRTLTICQLEVFGVKGETRTLVAVGQQTLICLAGRPDRSDG
ncbi:PaaI family thioesterase [Acuticoccus kandeliae]|uniref:PaaI family thioesterase n=1 Tax=Acuticoccus kandeliae TaxID=2073160 RepID=UPI001FE94EC9|nr:PaaI family thioesterase [Acuticoccus kandeliae]